MEQRPSTAIDKALWVLEALAEHESVTKIATATGLPKSTIHRILQALAEHGFARPDGSGGYLPGPKILTLAGRMLTRFDPVRQASPVLARLHEQTGYTVHFAVLNGDEAVYAAKLEGRKPYQMPSRVGMSLWLHSSAIGKAMLAAMSDTEVAGIAARTGLRRRTPSTITTQAALRRCLAEVRRQGFAIDDEENEQGVRCVGAAVFDHNGHVVAGVSLSTLTHELSVDDARELGPLVADTAREVSRTLGAPMESLASHG
ncbi:IclR family transcriptional regulator [Nonomuraea sp. NPDC049695]|uniref:IclR family transcriptional regulator n=1 Tax=Nonomuraea sp. NPDC049695 TaxID=3154734 RepID=UPI00344A7523